MTQGVMKIETSPIYAPTLGIIGNIPPTMLDPRAFTNCNNIRLKDGVASKRTGYVAYGTGAITGVPLLFFRYQKFNLTEYEILVTTTNVYYRDSGGAWATIVGATSLSGTVDVRASLAYIQNYMVFTNGVDAPSKWDGNTWDALDDGKTVGWADYRPKILVPYKDRLIGFNDNVSGSETGIRQIYSVLGDFDNVNDTPSAGYNDFVQGEGAQIMNAVPIKDYVAVYKDYSCCLLDYIGGASLYSLSPHIQGIGLAAKDAVANLGTSHMFLGSDFNIHEWNGGWELNHIGNPIKKLLQAEINKAKIKRSFAIINKEQREVIFFVAINSDNYPTRMWIYNLDDRSWSKGTIASISAGGSVTKAGVERALLGLSARTTHHYDYLAVNDGAGAISAWFETGDFVLDKKVHQRRQRKYVSIDADVKGSSASAKMKIEYSSDEGTSYTTAADKTLTAVYDWTTWNFLKTARKLRLRFSDATIGQRFYMRYYGLNQKEGEIG